MRVRVIGAGSIGSRHAANLAALGVRVDVSDVDAARALAVPDATAVTHCLDDLDGYDGIVVASPTVYHLDQARAALRAGCRVLVEKPLAVSGVGLDELLAVADGRLAVAYNLRLHPPVARTVRLALEGRVGRLLGVRLWFGSWLPDWRPAVDYRSTYSARRCLGGGVLFDAIHELDLAVWLAGPDLDVVGAVVDRVGPLEIDTEDTVRALLRTPAGVPVEVSLDYLSRVYRRGIEIIGETGTLRLDWAEQQITISEPSGTTVVAAAEPVADSYRAEAAAFVAWLNGGPPMPVDGETGAVSVRLAERIRAAVR